MGLSCVCDIEAEPGEWIYRAPTDFSVLKTSRRQRCTSCRKLIDIGADCGMISRYRIADHWIEEKIYGEFGEIPIAPHYMCEECAGLYFALDDLGFCASLYENQHKLITEYNAMRKSGEFK